MARGMISGMRSTSWAGRGLLVLLAGLIPATARTADSPKDRFMGVENGQFFLSHGGFIEGFTPFGQKFPRPATGKPPGDLDFLK